MKVKYRPHLTKACGLVKVGHNLADGLENVAGVRRRGTPALVDAYPTWSEALALYDSAKDQGRIKSTRWYMNIEQRQYACAVGANEGGGALMEIYEKWSDVHTLHLATRQGYQGRQAEAVLGKGHTPKVGYFAPGSAATLANLTRGEYLGWIMHTAERLHFLGRMPTNDAGQRQPVGRQASWAGLLEADLYLQAVTIPKSIRGLSTEEYSQFKDGLKHDKDTDRESLLALRALGRKS